MRESRRWLYSEREYSFGVEHAAPRDPDAIFDRETGIVARVNIESGHNLIHSFDFFPQSLGYITSNIARCLKSHTEEVVAEFIKEVWLEPLRPSFQKGLYISPGAQFIHDNFYFNRDFTTDEVEHIYIRVQMLFDQIGGHYLRYEDEPEIVDNTVRNIIRFCKEYASL